MSEVNAYVTTTENGQIVLHDPMAEAIIQVIEEHNRDVAYENCQKLYDDSTERIKYFRRRFDEKGYGADQFCIVVVQVDDIHGGPISDALMPGTNWQPIRDQGQTPIARGIADRDYIHDAIALFDQEAAKDLEQLEYAVVVIADSVARVFAI